MSLLYLGLIFLYTLFSYSQTDPNLVYSFHPVFQQFQTMMWSLGLDHRIESAVIFAIIICALFGAYLALINRLARHQITPGQLIKLVVASIFLLMVANPALSHDIFNYIFNARMILVHRANPHLLTAWDFPLDPWTRFVQNAHSPAPYGYGWTGLSLVPYTLGFGRLKLTILAFKLFVGAFFGLLVAMQAKLQTYLGTKNRLSLFMFMLNPLVLIETFGNGHNDVVMMALLLVAIYLGIKFWQAQKFPLLLLPLMLFGLSVSIKFASLTFIGGLLWWLVFRRIKIPASFGLTNSLAHFSPLLSARSQRFLPWYLIWSLSFLPFIKERRLVSILLVFSLSALLSYIPGLAYPIFDLGAYEQTIHTQKMIITFSLPVIYILLEPIYRRFNPKDGLSPSS